MLDLANRDCSQVRLAKGTFSVKELSKNWLEAHPDFISELNSLFKGCGGLFDCETARGLSRTRDKLFGHPDTASIAINHRMGLSK
jgi:hypothetical protein